MVGTKGRRWLEDLRDLVEQEQLSGNCHPWFIPAEILPFSHHNKAREGHRHLLSNLSASTLTSVQIPGKNIFNKLHFNEPFPPVNHNKRHFGKVDIFGKMGAWCSRIQTHFWWCCVQISHWFSITRLGHISVLGVVGPLQSSGLSWRQDTNIENIHSLAFSA